MTYRHGVYVSEMPTSLFPPVRTDITLPVVIGLAPVHKQDQGKGMPVNTPVLCYSYDEFVRNFNFDDDARYTLCEFARVYFSTYQASPFVAINVFDPHRHKTTLTAQRGVFDNQDIIRLPWSGITDITVKSADGNTDYQPEQDYRVHAPLGVIHRVGSGAIPTGAEVLIDYTHADPGKVEAEDIIGGIVVETGQRTGMELISEVFPRFRLVPGNIAAPGWSRHPEIAVLMGAKAASINGLFSCTAVVDLPSDQTLDVYSSVPEYKNKNNLMDKQMLCCWPKVQNGDHSEWMSTHLCGVMARKDAECEGIPYKSPSNNRYLGTGACLESGEPVWMGNEEANYLNGQGVITALNFIGGWTCWGSRTAAYPAVTDVKDAFLPIRRMFNWIGNTLILTSWQKVDAPVRKRMVETVCDSFNVWLNGLAGREIILGGRVEFRAEENPTTDLMDGIVRWHVFATPPSPGRELDFILEYDPQYLQALFG